MPDAAPTPDDTETLFISMRDLVCMEKGRYECLRIGAYIMAGYPPLAKAKRLGSLTVQHDPVRHGVLFTWKKEAQPA